MTHSRMWKSKGIGQSASAFCFLQWPVRRSKWGKQNDLVLLMWTAFSPKNYLLPDDVKMNAKCMKVVDDVLFFSFHRLYWNMNKKKETKMWWRVALPQLCTNCLPNTDKTCWDSFFLDIKSRVAFKQFWGRLWAKSLRPLAITQHLSAELH